MPLPVMNGHIENDLELIDLTREKFPQYYLRFDQLQNTQTLSDFDPLNFLISYGDNCQLRM